MRTEATRAVPRLFLLLFSGLLFVGHAGCHSHSPAPKTAAVPTDKIDSVISHWDSPLHPSVPPSSVAALQQFQAIRGHFALKSHRPFHKVEIPLFFQEGRPYVQASWSGRQIACLVDTGTGTIMWPQWLHLDSQQLNLATTQQWPEGVTTQSEWMLTPRIAVGDFVLTNEPTEAIGFPRPTSSDPIMLTSPILGCTLSPLSS